MVLCVPIKSKKIIDLTNRRFGLLTVLKLIGRKHGGALWLCKCDCGSIAKCRSDRLKSGANKSCGCLSKKMLGLRLNHGHSPRNKCSPTYISWSCMIQRCTNPNYKQYKDYGGRGVLICQRWFTFKNFLADMGERPRKLTLERINNEKGYELPNCKWATRSEQQLNRRKK